METQYNDQVATQPVCESCIKGYIQEQRPKEYSIRHEINVTFPTPELRTKYKELVAQLYNYALEHGNISYLSNGESTYN